MALPGLSRVARGGLALVAIATLVAAGGGCASRKVYREGAPAIVGAVGDRITIELASDPVTGYTWTLIGNPDPAVVILMETDYATSAGSTADTSGHQSWTFRLVGRGATPITFSYGRTWANAPAEKATLFNVTVR